MQPVLDGVTVSNGLEWSPDGSLRLLQRHRHPPHRRLRLRPATPASPGAVPSSDLADAQPDGLTVDAEGGVWVALYDGGAVRRYAPDGALDLVVEVPTPKVTACTFGGADLDELFVTTSREGLGPDDEPLAGSLFRAVPGVAGLPVREFAG